MKSKRIEWIDIAKGIGIILVVFGHAAWKGSSELDTMLCRFVYSFHMPLFFVLSGFLVKDDQRINKLYVKKVLYSYLLPFAIFTFIYVALLTLIEWIQDGTWFISFSNEYFVDAITFSGISPIWFLMALGLTLLLFVSIKTICRDSFVWLLVSNFVALVLTIFLGFTITPFLNTQPLFVAKTIVGLCRFAPIYFFVSLGYIAKVFIQKLSESKWFCKAAMLVVSLGVQILLFSLYPVKIDLHAFLLDNPVLYILKGINGTWIIISMAQLISSFKPLSYIGSKTKAIMIFHYRPFIFLEILRIVLSRFLNASIAITLISTVVTLGACLFMDWILSKIKIYNVLLGNPVK